MSTEPRRVRAPRAPAPSWWSPWILLGRVLLVVGPALVVLCRLTESWWGSAPLDEGGLSTHPIPGAAFLASVALAAAWPFLLLPIGSPRWSVIDDGVLVAPTVLGTRCVELHELVRAGGFRVLGRGGDLFVLRLRDADGHWVLLTRSGQDDVPEAVRSAVLALHRVHPEAVSPRLRARMRLAPVPPWPQRVARTLVTCAGFLAYIGAFFVVLGLLMTVSGQLT
ncbi:hypothetical protein IC607_08340 [Cellulomonas sp. JH27-2]|uniref:hypothetical protein n=1 Tax=Cellulomonas sp. JH27-2 TaxID=2774139 RepID=UPI0017823964|nr:hypothetical protein [Cellulomonas sp. JH27-2]MBD8058975.1 hypothetical protein [Cellulomonas sp. JH27-2]